MSILGFTWHKHKNMDDNGLIVTISNVDGKIIIEIFKILKFPSQFTRKQTIPSWNIKSAQWINECSFLFELTSLLNCAFRIAVHTIKKIHFKLIVFVIQVYLNCRFSCNKRKLFSTFMLETKRAKKCMKKYLVYLFLE